MVAEMCSERKAYPRTEQVRTVLRPDCTLPGRLFIPKLKYI